MEAELRARGLPLVSLETATPLREFDVRRLLAAVRADVHERAHAARPRRHPAARAPIAARTRPLVLAGGPTATHPEPLAPFIDAVFIGEARGGAAARSCARRRRCSARACRGASGLIRLAAQLPALRARAVRDRDRRRDRACMVVGAPLDPRVPARRRARAGRRPQPASRSPTTRRCRTPRRSSIACRSRSRAAAPRAAASARRA